MKRTLSSAFLFALSISASTLAFAEDLINSNSALTTPPPPRTRYIPSVPARTVEAPAPAPVAPINSSYIPSAPVRPTESMRKKIDNDSTTSRRGDVGLNTAMAKAYNFNPELFSYRSRLKAVDEQVPQAYSGWLPTAKINYGYGYDRETLNGRSATPNDKSHPINRSYSLSQPIFNGGESLARTSRAFNSVKLARVQLLDAEQRILGNAVKAYMDVVRTGEIRRLSLNNENVLLEQMQATKDRFKLGETTHTDVAQSESRYARAISDRVKAEGDYDVAKAAYLRVIGEPAPANLSMPAKLPTVPKTLEDALHDGLGKNPDMQAAVANRKISEDDVDLSKAALLPDVAFQGTKITDSNLTATRGFRVEEDTYMLNASIPIFQAGTEYSRIRQFKRTRQQRKEEFDASHDQTVQTITSRWRDLITARATIDSNKATVDSSIVALDGVKQEQEVGTRTTLDVLDAEQELFQAKVSLVTAQTKEVVAVYDLLAACGGLTASDLALNVQIYNPKAHEHDVRFRFIGF